MELNRQNDRNLGLDDKNTFVRLLKHFFLKEKAKPDINCRNSEEIELLESIREAHREWVQAVKNFEYAGDQASVDYYTYKIKACEVRYQYLLKKVKEKGIKLDILPQVDMYTTGPGEGISAN